MLEVSQRREIVAPQTRVAGQSQQPRKLMIALVLLLVALVAVLVKDRQFWFGSEQATIESDLPAAPPAALPTNPAPAPTPSAPAHSATKPVATAKTSSQPVAPQTPAVSTTRTVLPPLDIVVTGGDDYRTVRPSSRTRTEAAKAPAIQPEQSAATLTAPAAERTPVPVSATHLPQTNLHATYPVLSQHMNVQGSVVLEAVISADGVIQNVKVLSGPAILSSAAERAVREWHFKPIYQNGQAVESKAKITVNFSIRVGDSAPSSTLAQSTPASDPSLSR
jgi:protein TonB